MTARDTLDSDFFISKESGYDEWLFGKVSRSMERVATGKTQLGEHADAMSVLKSRLEARLRNTS
jgi:hypothetical protein